MPHTYQVRDFIPQLATSMQRTVISDCIGYRKDGDKLLFTRQMFQGKFAADITFACDAPWFVTFQTALFVETRRSPEPAPRPVETVKSMFRLRRFATNLRRYLRKPNKQSTSPRRDHRLCRPRNQRTEKHRPRQATRRSVGRRNRCVRVQSATRLAAMDRQIGSSGQTVAPKRISPSDQRCNSHIVGMKGARSVIAINKDNEAPIFEIADVAGGGQSVRHRAALIEEVKKARKLADACLPQTSPKHLTPANAGRCVIVRWRPGRNGLCAALSQLIDEHNAGHPDSQLSKENIYVLEKAREIGQHCLSGALLDPRSMRELLPDFRERSAARRCGFQRGGLLPHRKRQLKFPITPPPLARSRKLCHFA